MKALTFKEKQDVSKDKDFKISPQQDIKESWAMSVDTRLEEQKKEFTNLRDDVKAENEKTKNEINDSHCSDNRPRYGLLNGGTGCGCAAGALGCAGTAGFHCPVAGLWR